MITEYSVLSVLRGHRQATLYEISPSSQWEDLYNTNQLLECLMERGVIEISYYSKGENSEHVPVYEITTSGEYRLRELREKQEHNAKTIGLLNALNEKIDIQQKENKYQSQINKKWQIAGFVIGLLTLIASIISVVVGILTLFH